MERGAAVEGDVTGAMNDPAKTKLLSRLHQICEEYQLKSRGRERTQAVLAMLVSETCERRTRFMLANPTLRDDARFDPFYREKSDLATSMILSSVVDALTANGLSAGLATETRDTFGTYDVTLQRGSPSLLIRGGSLIGRIEVKASWGLPLPQIARYLLSESPLVISRVMPGTAILLDPLEHDAFVKFMAELLASKAGRILRDAPKEIPGRYCGDCRDRGCSYYVGGNSTKRMVSPTESAFQQDLDLFFANIPKVCASTSRLVLSLVNGTKEALPH